MKADSFEGIVAMLLEREGYWTRTSFKVNLTKEEKRMIGRPSSPRWEIDLVGYKAGSNEIIAVECKSLLDSPGVMMAMFKGIEPYSNRVKLFIDQKLQDVVFNRLRIQLEESGIIAMDSTIRLGLAAGKYYNERDAEQIRAHFREKGWLLLGPEWIVTRLKKLSDTAYENCPIAMTSKLLIRNRNMWDL